MSSVHEGAAETRPGASSPSPERSEQSGRDLAEIAERFSAVKREIAKVYIGPDEVVEALMVGLLARGHILIEGVPGIAKTTLVKTFSRTLDCSFRRIQFTPDLLPSDITGTYIFDRKTSDFVLREGPIFSNIVLGDEINRAPAKTQSALLEAMQEVQVTVEGTTRPLERPFMVLATQNPIEQEGVYLLPEAQLDRFLIKLDMGYPTLDDEMQILRTHSRPTAGVEPVLGPGDVLDWAERADTVTVRDEMMEYIVRLVRFTREAAQVSLGASPRAAIALLRSAKARAILRGRDYVLPDDIKALAGIVLPHRILLHPESELGGLTSDQVVRAALDSVRYAGPES